MCEAKLDFDQGFGWVILEYSFHCFEPLQPYVLVILLLVYQTYLKPWFDNWQQKGFLSDICVKFLSINCTFNASHSMTLYLPYFKTGSLCE